MNVSSGPLLKIGMAVDNDELFVIRVKAACALTGVEYTRGLALRVASYVADQIEIEDGPMVSTAGVDDLKILEALTLVEPSADTSALRERFENSASAVTQFPADAM